MAWMEFKKVKSYEHKSKEGEQALLSQLEKGKKLSESDLCSLVQCYCVEEATTDIDRIALREYVGIRNSRLKSKKKKLFASKSLSGYHELLNVNIV